MTSRTSANTGDICVALSAAEDRLPYTWSLLIPISNTEGERFHVEDGTQAGREYQRGRQPLVDPYSLVIVRIGAPSREEHLNVNMRLTLTWVAGQLSTSGMSISDLDAALRRVPVGGEAQAWFRHALIDLHECGFVECPNVGQLMDELLTLAMVVQQKGVRGAHFISMVSR